MISSVGILRQLKDWGIELKDPNIQMDSNGGTLVEGETGSRRCVTFYKTQVPNWTEFGVAYYIKGQLGDSKK